MVEAREKALPHLGLWIDAVAREGPEQMACDEALLAEAAVPVMRVFRWSRPWVSAGYFTPREKAAAVRPDLPLCRRWTGGGVVVHEGDFTFSLAVPRGEDLAAARPAESYRRIHLAVSAALGAAGTDASLAGRAAGGACECFAAAVEHDVVARGAKVAGGAQRRTRRGFLHQGSVQTPSLDRENFTRWLARSLSGNVTLWSPPRNFEGKVASLAREKYACPRFLAGAGGRRTLQPSRTDECLAAFCGTAP